MTTITVEIPASTISLEVPDELARQYKLTPDVLPALIREAVSTKFVQKAARRKLSAPPVYQEIIAFLQTTPNAQQIIDFKISAAAQRRLNRLLDANREGTLTPEEKAELETYSTYSSLLVVLKARARSGKPFVSPA